jgi:DNA-binding NarL/FixJ family response regulator
MLNLLHAIAADVTGFCLQTWNAAVTHTALEAAAAGSAALVAVTVRIARARRGR